MRTRRPWYLLMLGAVAGPLVLASAAWACANLATLTLDSSQATAGETVNFTGSRFGETGPAPKAGEVVLHWNARDGEVLGSVPADASRNISGSITIPNVPAGNYVVVATQLKADGDPVAGTPGRYPIEVVAANTGSASVGSGAPLQAAPVAAPEQAPVAAAEQAPVAAAEQAPVAAPQQSSAPAAPQAPVAAPQQSSAPAAPQAPVAAPEQSAPASAAPEVAVAPATSGPAAPVALDSSPVASRTALATPAASSGSSLLPLALVGIGLALSLVSSAMVLANRRSYSLARAAR